MHGAFPVTNDRDDVEADKSFRDAEIFNATTIWSFLH